VSVALAVPVASWAVLSVAAFLFLWLDRYQLDLVPWLAGVAAWGFAVPAVLAAAGARLPHLLGAPGAGSPVPELWLALPALAVALPCLGVALPVAAVARSRFLEGPSSGAVFGVMAGLAFSLGMHLLVVTRAAWQPSAAALVFLSLLHAAVGASLGAGIGLARLAAPPQLRIPAVLGAVTAAAGLGALLVFGAVSCWASWGERSVACNLALAGVGLTVLLGVFGFSISYERRVLAGQLAEEVRLGVLPRWVAEVMPSYRRRIRSDWWGRRDERREILRLLAGLAFRKHRLRNLPEEKARLYGLEVGRLRQRARVLVALPPTSTPAAPGTE
jgi:hypothetical protein